MFANQQNKAIRIQIPDIPHCLSLNRKNKFKSLFELNLASFTKSRIRLEHILFPVPL